MPQLTENLEQNLQTIQTIFHAPENGDLIVRRSAPHGVDMAVLFIDGMANRTGVEDMVMRPLLNMRPFGAIPPQERAQELLRQVLPTGTGRLDSNMDNLIPYILSGNCVLLVQGSKDAVLMDMTGFASRGVGQPLIENAAFTSHEAFNESIRTNLTLLHRILKTPDLVSKMMSIGSTSHTAVSLVYLRGTADPALVREAQRRLEGIDIDRLLSIGQLQQLLEDRPDKLLPQMIQTERPDRAASFLTDGMIVLLCDNSPFALAAPATFLTFLHTPDDHALRWQYGTFIRTVRTLGFLTALLLPALYNAVLLYHQDLLPADLLTSILEGYTLVPLGVTVELLLMDFLFDLLGEASLRMPGGMGGTLGIVGGLVLGQAAVSANLISPVLIIVVSVAGLGLYAIPSYPLSLAVRIARLVLVLASTAAGFAGIALVGMAFLCSCAAMDSFGTPYFAPIAPSMRRNADGLFTRGSIRRQTRLPGMARPTARRASSNPRGWEKGGRP